MILRNLADAIRQQNWFTVVLEVLIVVVGIFIGLQVDDWNQSRKDRTDIANYMERIQLDLNRDFEFFTFISGEAEKKRRGLAALKRIIRADGPSDENPEVIFEFLSDSSSLGFEFPEVQTVTFYDLQSSGKLVLIEDAVLRRQLSFYYQESLHRGDRIESRITGYAAALYEMADSQIGIVGRDVEMMGKASRSETEKSETGRAVKSFLEAAKKERFRALLTAEQNYTGFMIMQLKFQMEQIRELQQAITSAGYPD